MKLFQRLFDEAKVYLLPGCMCHSEVPGWFRIVFAVGDDRWECLRGHRVILSLPD